MLFTSALVFLGALAGLANASASTFSQTKCYTGYGTNKPLSVPTRSAAETLIFPVVVKTTYVPSTTVTPMAITSTSTVVSTSTAVITLSQSTDTFSTTTTFFSTTTFTSTASTTTTVGTTTTLNVPGGTTTVPTSAGFTPLASVVAAAGGMPSRRKRDEQKLRGDIIEREPYRPPPPLPRPGADQQCAKSIPGRPKPPAKYPNQVFCNTVYEVLTTNTITFTASKTSTITAQPVTSTVTSTSTITSTSTATIPDASTTITLSTTSTISTTTTTTTTDIQTSTISVIVSGSPTATAYAACQSNNLITNYAPGQAFTNADSDFGSYIYGSATSGYDCCVQCVNAGSSCGGSLFYTGGSNTCVFLYTSGNNNQCNPGGSDGYLIVNDGNDADVNSNSNCGMFRIGS